MQMTMRKKWIWRLSLCITIGLLSYLGIKAKEINQVINQLDTRLEKAYEELAVEEANLKILQDEREQMDTIEYIEKIAREKLGMVKEDDIVFKEKYR